MNKPEKTPKGQGKRLALFDDRADVYRFLNPMLRVLFLAIAVGLFLQILVDYPDELDAMYHLAQLYDLKFDSPEKALGEYRRLKRKVNEHDKDYQYKDALEERINELKEHLGH
ncbi:MAG: hypothetical protein ACE5EN_07655 [Nitrospinota bacterium]